MLYPYFGWRHLPLCAGVVVVAIGSGLWEKYRSSFGSWYALLVVSRILAMLTFTALGGAGVLLSAALRRPDLVPLGGLLTCLSLTTLYLLGMMSAAKTVRAEPVQTEPDWLLSRVDTATGLFTERPASQSMPRWQWMLLAFALNIPLLWKGWGFGEYSFLLLVVPVVNVLIGRLFFAAGVDMAYLWHIMTIERRLGRRFKSPHIEEIRALRRTFWFAKWLCKPEDLVEPPAPVGRMPSRNARRKLRAADSRGERAATR